MSIHAEEQWAIGLLPFSVQAHGLTNGEDVPFVESLLECRATMSRGAEGNPLCLNRRVRHLCIVGRDESGHVHQHRCFSRLSCMRTYFHSSFVECREERFAKCSYPGSKCMSLPHSPRRTSMISRCGFVRRLLWDGPSVSTTSPSASPSSSNQRLANAPQSPG